MNVYYNASTVGSDLESLIDKARKHSIICIKINPDVMVVNNWLQRLLQRSGIRSVIVCLSDGIIATTGDWYVIADAIRSIQGIIESIDIVCFKDLVLSTDLCQIISESKWKHIGGVDLSIATNVCAVVARCLNNNYIRSVSFSINATHRIIQCMNIGLCLSICENLTEVTLANTSRSSAFCGGTIHNIIDMSVARAISQSKIKSLVIKRFTVSCECMEVLNCMMKCVSMRSIKFVSMLWSFGPLMAFTGVLSLNPHVIGVSIDTNCDEEILLAYLSSCSHLRTLEFGTEHDTDGIKQKYTEQKIKSILDTNTNLVSCVSLMSPAMEVAVRRCERKNEHLRPSVMTRILIDLCMTIGVVLQSPYLINDIYNIAYTNNDSHRDHVQICINVFDSMRRLCVIE